MDILWWILIPVAIVVPVALGYIWWKTSKIKKEVREGTYVTKELREELKKQGIKIKDYKKELRDNKDDVKEIKSHEDYMNELRRMG